MSFNSMQRMSINAVKIAMKKNSVCFLLPKWWPHQHSIRAAAVREATNNAEQGSGDSCNKMGI